MITELNLIYHVSTGGSKHKILTFIRIMLSSTSTVYIHDLLKGKGSLYSPRQKSEQMD